MKESRKERKQERKKERKKGRKKERKEVENQPCDRLVECATLSEGEHRA